tara:strand:+ start:34 stop:492 length:459 start_codon:yes stop_codon:yes gene_type:complete
MPKKTSKKKEAEERKRLAEERRTQAEQQKKEFEEAMKASREARTTEATLHAETMKNIENEPRRLVLTAMTLPKLKHIAEGYTDSTSHIEHGFKVKSNIKKNELIEKLLEFESSIDSNPHLQFGEEAGKKYRKHHTLKGGKRKHRRKYTRKHR